jgi:hypothetical protein
MDVLADSGREGSVDVDARLVNLETGEAKQIISIAQVAALGEIPNEQPGIKHYFNHLLINPDGTRFIALHRWRYPNERRLTRMITANPDGSDNPEGRQLNRRVEIVVLTDEPVDLG